MLKFKFKKNLIFFFLLYTCSGDDEKAAEIKQKLHELEERAEELDKLRTSTISSISYINDRNRKKNVEEAEKAIMEELRANKGKKIDDPFTRRSTKPRMVFKAQDQADAISAAGRVSFNFFFKFLNFFSKNEIGFRRKPNESRIKAISMPCKRLWQPLLLTV